MNASSHFSHQAAGTQGHPGLPDSQTHLDAVATRLLELVGGIRSLDRDLQSMHDRAFGAEPEKQGGSIREAQPGMCGSLNHRVEDIEMVIASMRAKIDRLSAFV